ncbi:MAG: HDOD domain-containing protein, partial [Mariprofundaceae bacterium]|nr:HDOD domain-containing protein [Mariprofundaceae bacterium]
VMMRDVTLSYRLLRHINSAAFGLRSKVESVRQALGLLGLSNIRQWLSLLLLADAGKGLPIEVVRLALQRAKMLEGIAELHLPERKSDYFLLGLFSLLDTILGVSMQDALAKLCLPEAIHQGLLDADSSYGRLLQLVKDVEQGDWGNVDELAHRTGIKCGDLMGVQTRALHWVKENSGLLGGD